MNKPLFKENELPMAELEKIGLAENGRLKLSSEDKNALLAGGRTELLRLHDLIADNYRIDQMDAKVSFARNATGTVELKLHPIYHEADYPAGLTDLEAQDLQNGQRVAVYKKLKDQNSAEKEYLFEYDPQTREFIKTDTGKILVPDLVNGETLSEKQRADFRLGKEVQLADGTQFRYTGVDQNAIRANRLALIASLLTDGGITYMLLQGLKALDGLRNNSPESVAFSKGYYKSIEDMKNQEADLQLGVSDFEQDKAIGQSRSLKR
jgi:hypothetical protein